MGSIAWRCQSSQASGSNSLPSSSPAVAAEGMVQDGPGHFCFNWPNSFQLKRAGLRIEPVLDTGKV